MHRVSRIVLCLILLALSGTSVSQASQTAEPNTRLYIGQSARLTADIPADWTVGPGSRVDYQGADGFVVSYPVSGQSLEAACDNFAGSALFSDEDSTVVESTWSGHTACRVDGITAGGPASALVVSHPHPFDRLEDHITYAALMTDADHFTAISATLSFSPDRVTPVAYVSSVLDLLEARAYFAGDVD